MNSYSVDIPSFLSTTPLTSQQNAPDSSLSILTFFPVTTAKLQPHQSFTGFSGVTAYVGLTKRFP